MLTAEEDFLLNYQVASKVPPTITKRAKKCHWSTAGDDLFPRQRLLLSNSSSLYLRSLSLLPPSSSGTGSIGGGLRSNVKRYTVQRVTLDADTVNETINTNSSLPEPAQEKLAWGCSCQVIVQTGITAQLKDDMYSRNRTLSSNLDSGNLTGFFCHLALPRGRENPTQVCLRPGDNGDKKPQDQSSLPETSMASYGTSVSDGKLPLLEYVQLCCKEDSSWLLIVQDKCQLSKDDPASTASTSKVGATMNPAVLDYIITRLLEVRSKPGKQVELNESEVRQLCRFSREIFLEQPNLLELEAPICICGNIHGQYSDLLRLFELGGSPPSVNYLFLGGYVDYGKQSLETIWLLLAYKIKYPDNFFLLRGNNECASINRIYGFYDECKRRFNVRLWKCFTDVFNCLPVAALIDDKIFCMHGGISPDLTNLDQIRNLPRPTDVPDTGLLCDLLGSDPGRDVRGWGMNDRGVSYTFGPDRVAEFLMKHDLDLICRAHQVVEDGYEFFAARQLVTIFSAPHFCGEYDNAGAIMRVDETLMCSFQVLKPGEKKAKFMVSTKM